MKSNQSVGVNYIRLKIVKNKIYNFLFTRKQQNRHGLSGSIMLTHEVKTDKTTLKLNQDTDLLLTSLV